jgi:hypothetical protein
MVRGLPGYLVCLPPHFGPRPNIGDFSAFDIGDFSAFAKSPFTIFDHPGSIININYGKIRKGLDFPCSRSGHESSAAFESEALSDPSVRGCEKARRKDPAEQCSFLA